MIIVDTSIWIDYINKNSSPQVIWLDTYISTLRLGLTDLILCEVLQGFSNEKQARVVEQALRTFAIYSSAGVNLAIASAKNYRFLRNKGRTVRKTVDCFIATLCILDNHQLLHNDRDFDLFENYLGLRVVHP